MLHLKKLQSILLGRGWEANHAGKPWCLLLIPSLWIFNRIFPWTGRPRLRWDRLPDDPRQCLAWQNLSFELESSLPRMSVHPKSKETNKNIPRSCPADMGETSGMESLSSIFFSSNGHRFRRSDPHVRFATRRHEWSGDRASSGHSDQHCAWPDSILIPVQAGLISTKITPKQGYHYNITVDVFANSRTPKYAPLLLKT